MTARSKMTMRADVERNTATGTDAHGHPVAPVFAALATLPCHVYSRASRQVADGAKTALVEDLRGLFPAAADLREGDEIARVTDRKGAALFAGRLRVDAPPLKKTGHLEAMLQRVQ